MLKLLFTNSGRRTYLIEFALTLKNQGYPLEIFCSDASQDVPTFWISDEVRTFTTPWVDANEAAYVDFLLEKCAKLGINLIIPLMDFELHVLAKYKARFTEKNITVVISSLDFVEGMLSKKTTFDLCIKHNIPTPECYFSYAEIPENAKIVRKRIKGSGSVGLSIHDSKRSLTDFEEGLEMAQAFIEGQEYGIDVFNSLKGEFLHASFRKKLGMRAGETDKAEIIFSERFTELARHISQSFKHIGNLDMDLLVDDKDQLYCIDFNPRFGGGYPFSHLAGFNYLKLIFDQCLGNPIVIPEGKAIVGYKGINVFFHEL
jgi:carbamoyl-phosphate synthase large subunit